MIKRFKRFLWDNPKTHRPYKFLWHWKNENLRAAIVFWNEKNANNIQQEPIIKVEKIIKELYITPPILNKVHYADTQKYKIFACAFRIYDEKSGKTGGPGGVLAMQRETMGSLYRDCEIEYLFEPEKLEIPSMLENEIKNLAFMVKKNFYASFFIQTSERIKKSVREGKQPLLLCHDLGSAYGAYLCGYKYVLIYHQQGGLINELEGFHTFLTETDKYIINEMEKVVFTNAEKVYFPSLGAREMFVETSSTGTLFSNDIKYADFAVYNTIKKQTVLESNNIFEKLGILSVDKTTTDVFLSIGDFNENRIKI